LAAALTVLVKVLNLIIAVYMPH